LAITIPFLVRPFVDRQPALVHNITNYLKVFQFIQVFKGWDDPIISHAHSDEAGTYDER